MSWDHLVFVLQRAAFFTRSSLTNLRITRPKKNMTTQLSWIRSMASKWTSLFKEKSYSKRRSSTTYQSGGRSGSSKKQFSSIFEKMNKKKPSFTVQFDESAIDHEAERVHLDTGDKSPMRLRKRSQVCLVLTQLYSLDFSQSRFASVVVPGTSASSAAHLKVSLYLCSSQSNGQGESRALEGRRVGSKSPSRVLQDNRVFPQ